MKIHIDPLDIFPSFVPPPPLTPQARSARFVIKMGKEEAVVVAMRHFNYA